MSDRRRSRNRSAAKLGAKLVTALKKGVPKRTKVSYDSEHQKVSVSHKAASSVELHIEDLTMADRGGYYDNAGSYPVQLRLTAWGADRLTGTYKLKDGDLSDKKLAKAVERVVAFLQKAITRQEYADACTSHAFSNFAAAQGVMNRAGFKRASRGSPVGNSWSNGRKLARTAEQMECEFGPKGKDPAYFRVTVTGLGREGRVEISFYHATHECHVDRVGDYAQAMHEHEKRIHELNALDEDECAG